ncbi:MAG: fibronectin type III domain-containing protein [Spirochaetales bacterium]|nr:fibronectin type III domain-containing protein [Spirochaetales bacterium]
MIASFHAFAPGRLVRFIVAVALVSIPTVCASTVGADESLIIDATTVSPSSAQPWRFEGTQPDAPDGTSITLTPGPAGADTQTDLYLSFDKPVPEDGVGHWTAKTIGPYQRSEASRFGDGAGSFRAPATKLVLRPTDDAFFVPETPLGDLTLEFWLKPTRADSGEIVFLWKSNRRAGKAWLPQQISCIVLKNRIVFGFLNFFAASDATSTTLSLQGSSVLIPGSWSHHLVRFDSSTGLLEYAQNGEVEAIAYATSTGRESGTVYTPISGASARLEMGLNYTGLIDEFKLGASLVDAPILRRYPASGGVAVSPVMDLGETNSKIVAITPKTRTPGESAVHWSYRVSDSPAGWTADSPAWIPFTPGTLQPVNGAPPSGRYLQIHATLYPDASGESSPTVADIVVAYQKDDPPSPPPRVSAAPGDKRITVRWSTVAESDISGYVVYYGLRSGDYFGSGAREGASPIFVEDAGATSLTLNGLENGTLYFIAVAAYDGATPPHIGEFSRELTARPSRVSP